MDGLMMKYVFLTAAALTLAGCATMLDSSSQPIYFHAVGATEAACEAETSDGTYRYHINMPAKVQVQKSRRDLVLNCRAAGNRFKTMVVPSSVSGWTAANVTNGLVPGTAYDVTSGAAFEYPDVVTVDFTGTVASMDKLPGYEAPDALNPETASAAVEDMGPVTNKLPGDDALALRHQMAQMEREREDALDAERTMRKENVEGGWTGDKGGPDMRSTSAAGGGYVPPAYEPPVGDVRSAPDNTDPLSSIQPVTPF